MASLADYAELIVAEDDNRLVGAVGYVAPATPPRADFFDFDWAIVRMLVVDPDSRGKGIARKLTDECVARARRDHAPVIALHTSPTMEVALRMYLKMGFKFARSLPDRIWHSLQFVFDEAFVAFRMFMTLTYQVGSSPTPEALIALYRASTLGAGVRWKLEMRK